MKTKGYLIVGRNGSLRAVKRIKSPVAFDELAIAVDVSIPDEAFKPVFHANIHVENKDAVQKLIDTGKISKLQDRISQEFGLNIKLSNIAEDIKPRGK